MQTTLVSGNISSLAITVSTTLYAKMPATPFVKHSNPGPATRIPPNITNIKKTSIMYKFTLGMEFYMLHQNMYKALNQKLLGLMEDIYVRDLKKNYIGYRNHT